MSAAGGGGSESDDSDDSDDDDEDGLLEGDDDVVVGVDMDDLLGSGCSSPTKGVGKAAGRVGRSTRGTAAAVSRAVDLALEAANASRTPALPSGTWEGCFSGGRFVCCPVGSSLRLGLVYGAGSSKGRLSTMEDRWVALPDLNAAMAALVPHAAGSPRPPPPATYPQYSFFAVYDGHCGVSTCEALAQSLHFRLAQRLGLLPEGAEVRGGCGKRRGSALSNDSFPPILDRRRRSSSCRAACCRARESRPRAPRTAARPSRSLPVLAAAAARGRRTGVGRRGVRQ